MQAWLSLSKALLRPRQRLRATQQPPLQSACNAHVNKHCARTAEDTMPGREKTDLVDFVHFKCCERSGGISPGLPPERSETQPWKGTSRQFASAPPAPASKLRRSRLTAWWPECHGRASQTLCRCPSSCMELSSVVLRVCVPIQLEETKHPSIERGRQYLPCASAMAVDVVRQREGEIVHGQGQDARFATALELPHHHKISHHDTSQRCAQLNLDANTTIHAPSSQQRSPTHNAKSHCKRRGCTMEVISLRALICSALIPLRLRQCSEAASGASPLDTFPLT